MKIQIQTDGTPEGTIVTDENGKPLPGDMALIDISIVRYKDKIVRTHLSVNIDNEPIADLQVKATTEFDPNGTTHYRFPGKNIHVWENATEMHVMTPWGHSMDSKHADPLDPELIPIPR